MNIAKKNLTNPKQIGYNSIKVNNSRKDIYCKCSFR